MIYFLIMEEKGAKILVVDDEPDVCEFVGLYFGKRGLRVSSTPRGKEALSMIEEIKPDLILLDVTLQDMTGIEVLEELRKTDKETKVLIMTGQVYSEKEVHQIRSMGVSEFLNKPVVLEEFAEVVFGIIKNEPFPQRDRVYKESIEEEEPKSLVGHKLANLIGIIRNKCETFTFNKEEGIYKNKTDAELVQMSVDIMKNIIHTTERATEVIEEIKENKKS